MSGFKYFYLILIIIGLQEIICIEENKFAREVLLEAKLRVSVPQFTTQYKQRRQTKFHKNVKINIFHNIKQVRKSQYNVAMFIYIYIYIYIYITNVMQMGVYVARTYQCVLMFTVKTVGGRERERERERERVIKVTTTYLGVCTCIHLCELKDK